MLNDTSNYCRVCGLDQGEPPWGEDGSSPTFGICACCGVEFGYEDSTLEGLKEFRENWLKNGCQWDDKKKIPPNWSLEEQIKNIPKEFL